MRSLQTTTVTSATGQAFVAPGNKEKIGTYCSKKRHLHAANTVPIGDQILPRVENSWLQVLIDLSLNKACLHLYPEACNCVADRHL